MDSVVIIVEQLPIIVLQNNRLAEGSIRDESLRTKSVGKKQLKSCETRQVAYIRRYTSGHVIPNSVMVID